MKYTLTETLSDNNLWVNLLNLKLSDAEFVEFNTLFKNKNLYPELDNLKVDLVAEGKRKDKIYPSGKFHRYYLTDRIKQFILSKPYKTWKNYQFEDLSLIKNGVEILATITHENYIFISITQKEKIELNKNGYDFGNFFELDWKT